MGETNTQGEKSQAGLDACRVLSVALRQGLAIYGVTELELRLALFLCLETYDKGLECGRVDIPGWTRKLGMRDAKGWREDKCEKLFATLIELAIVDLDEGRGTYRLRPAVENWSRMRALRAGLSRLEEPELKFCASDRPLSEALSDLSRETALTHAAAPRAGGMFFTKLRELVQRGASDEELAALGAEAQACLSSSDKSADALHLAEPVRRINPPKVSANSSENVRLIHPTVSADKSADKQVPDGRGPPTSADKSADIRLIHPTPSLALASLAPVQLKAKLAKASSSDGAGTGSVPLVIPLSEAPVSAEKSADVSAKSSDTQGARELAAVGDGRAPPKTTEEKRAEKSVRVAGARAWLVSVDEHGDLHGWVREQWDELVARDPDYVLRRLRGALEDNRKRYRQEEREYVQSPLAWLATKAREEGQLKPVGRKD